MSFVHCTIVGHFDPATLFADRPLEPIRPLEADAVMRLLAEYAPEVVSTLTSHKGSSRSIGHLATRSG